MRARVTIAIVASMLAVACGGGGGGGGTGATRGEPTMVVEERTGYHESDAREPREPLPDLPSPPEGRSTTAFVDRDYRYVMRLEMASLRDTPLEPEARRMMESIRYWRDIMEGSGLDPIEQIDRLVVASPEQRSSAFVVLARHHAPAEQMRATVRALAETRELDPGWREVDGLQVARWAMRDERPRSIVILDEHWVAIAPNEQVRRMIAVAAREDGAELVPGTSMPWAESEPLVPDGAGLYAAGREGVRDERPEHYPVHFDFHARVREDGGVVCEWRGTYVDADEAKTAHRHWEKRRQSYASNMMVNILDLDRPIEDAKWSRDGEELTFELDLTLEEMALLIRFATTIMIRGG